VMNNSTLSGGNGIITDVRQDITFSNSSTNVGSYGIRVNQGNGTITISDSSIKSNSVGVELNSASNTLTITNTEFNTSSTSINSSGTLNEIEITHSNIKSNGTAVNTSGTSNTIVSEYNNINASTGYTISGANSIVTIDNNTITAGTTGINMIGGSITSTITNNDITSSGTGISSTGNSCISTVNNNEITANGVGINHRGTSNTMNIDDLTLEAKGNGIYHTGDSSSLIIKNSEITSTGATGIMDDSSTNTSTKATLTMTNTNVTGATYGVYLYYCDSTITGGEIKTTSKSKDNYAMASMDWAYATVTDTVFTAEKASGLRSNGRFNLNNVSVYAGNDNAYGVYADYIILNINNSTIEAPGPYAYGVYSDNSTGVESIINLNSGSITSGYIGIGLHNSKSQTRSLTVLDGIVKGEVYGVYQTQNYTTTIGDVNEQVDIYNPNISGGLYGVYTTSGTTSFYSGRLKGGVKAYNGIINNIKDGYEIFEDREEMLEYQKGIRTLSTTSVSAEAVSKAAKTGNGYAKITYNQHNNTQTSETNYTIVDEIGSSNSSGNVSVKYDFDYTGSYQEFTAPYTGRYTVEAWGASGGDGDSTYVGGKGGYTSGTIDLTKGTKLYIYVGGAGTTNGSSGAAVGSNWTSTRYLPAAGGYNGGGTSGNQGIYNGSGGGATDVRLVSGNYNDFDSLKSRIMVAAGGGGGAHYDSSTNAGNGGSAGGLNGYDGEGPVVSGWSRIGGGAAQNTTGYDKGEVLAGFGQGGSTNEAFRVTGGGGGGYYGGSAGGDYGAGGGGGSSFISGKEGCNAISNQSTDSSIVHTGQPNHYSGKVFTDTQMIDGMGYVWTSSKGEYVGQIQPDGSSSNGHSGNGHARITLTNISSASSNNSNSSLVYTYNYTGQEEIFTPTIPGTYQIEVWGAQGGTAYSDSQGLGGYGGYSVGKVTLGQNDKLYINVGGQGQFASSKNTDYAGGYNGGGNAYYWYDETTYNGSGGGATSVAKKSGLLSTLENSKDKVLIVAGGGGGGASDGISYAQGGTGGGYVGGAGDMPPNGDGSTGLGGTQTEGGSYNHYMRAVPNQGSFGLGGSSALTNVSGYGGGTGAGGGWYGGGAGGVWGGAGGGSGYIGNELLSDKHMYCYNCSISSETATKTLSNGYDSCHSSDPTNDCAKEGNGYVKITYIETEYEYEYTGDEQVFNVPISGTYEIEAWGAQGGSLSGYHGGYGGYATGSIYLIANEKLFMNIGGAGKGATGQGQSLVGGYNGGGYVVGNGSVNHMTGSGGGATHIATRTGLLSELENDRDKIIIVAGGGGGARDQVNHVTAARWGYGGSGGGFMSSGAYSNYNTNTSTQQTYCISSQTYGYRFGQGEDANGNAAGGGGYLGGFSGASGGGYQGYGECGYYLGSGSGGSGYIGNSQLENKKMACYNCTESEDEDTKTISNECSNSTPESDCSKQGNGAIKIKLKEIAQQIIISLSTNYGVIENDYLIYSSRQPLGDIAPPVIDQDDLLFEGWYLDENYTLKVTENTIVNSSATLYAKFRYNDDYCASVSNVAYTFDYTGGEQEFVPLCTGTYTLEVWGAQGGTATSSYRGGYGSYSVANVDLQSGEKIYINVGGQGSSSNNAGIARGGYNGGGNGYGNNCNGDPRYGAGGGGATHIATTSGLLSEFEGSQDELLIAAGGGGGGFYLYAAYGVGAEAGGYIGNSPTWTNRNHNYYVRPTGGTQSGGGKSGYSYSVYADRYASFGLGDSYNGGVCSDGSGGGGGYYGGGQGQFAPGAGGSGYIGNSKLSNQYMYGYNVSTVYTSEDLTVAYLVPATDKIRNVEQDKTYNNVQDAFAEVNDGDTLELTRDVSVSYDITVPNKVVTLDLKGHNFITNKTINNNGTLTIEDSTLTQGVRLTSTVSNTLIANNKTVTLDKISVTGYDIINSAEESEVILDTVNITGHNIVTAGTDANVSVVDSTIEGTDIISTGVRTTVTISGSVLTSNGQAVNTAGELNVTNSNITGATYGIYTNTAENVTISNTSIRAENALYNNGAGVIEVSNNCNLYGKVNNSNGTGTLNVTGGIINGPINNSGRSTIKNITNTYVYDTSGEYNFITNSGTLQFESVNVTLRNTNGTNNGYAERMVYNTGTFNSLSGEYIFSGDYYRNRTYRVFENRGILHSTSDKLSITNRYYVRAIEVNSSNITEVRNVSITIPDAEQAMGIYAYSGSATLSTGLMNIKANDASSVYAESPGTITAENVTSTIEGRNIGRAAQVNGGSITYRNGTSTISGPTSYCLTATTGSIAMIGGTCEITSSTNAYGLSVNNGTITMTGGEMNITASSTGYGVQMANGTANIESGSMIVTAPTAYGVYMSAGTMTIGTYDGSGTQQGDVSDTDPHIEARGSTTGIGSSMGNGTMNFYDGKIIGSTRARAEGDITSAVEKNYQVVTRTDEETGYQYCILEFIM
nr:hypothetical protein [Bacilli bacterium]